MSPELAKRVRENAMRAARLHAYGEPLRLEDVEIPQPQGEQILVKVEGSGVCRSDLYVADGDLPEAVRLPVTMGHEIAGRVLVVRRNLAGQLADANLDLLL
ncbi:MAG: alcohol dehydrogenase catalytic domain-containing protein [Bacteroidetes bacterium]|nr:alcohol dehydrogenase catalytic domain-containing protein [Bacteroidota bacterium]